MHVSLALRRFDRIISDLPVTLLRGEQTRPGVLRQISVGGVFVEMDGASEVGRGECVSIRLEVEGQGAATVQGEVVYTLEDYEVEPGRRCTGLGVRFIDLPPAVEAMLGMLIETEREAGSKPRSSASDRDQSISCSPTSFYTRARSPLVAARAGTAAAAARRPRRLSSLISQALSFDEADAYAAGEVGFMARAVVQATMPHSDPKTNELVRHNGHYSLSILAPQGVGLPSGRYPRLVVPASIPRR